LIGCEESTSVAGSTQYSAALNGANEKPTATTSTGTGFFSASLHPTNNTLSYSLTWTGLTGAINGAHIHGPADANGVANVLVNFQALPAGSTNGTITTGATGAASGNVDLKLAITATVSGDSLKTLLDAGQLYVNVHTVANGGGEIRGQIAKQ
jgi:hypothetical protein